MHIWNGTGPHVMMILASTISCTLQTTPLLSSALCSLPSAPILGLFLKGKISPVLRLHISSHRVNVMAKTVLAVPLGFSILSIDMENKDLVSKKMWLVPSTISDVCFLSRPKGKRPNAVHMGKYSNNHAHCQRWARILVTCAPHADDNFRSFSSDIPSREQKTPSSGQDRNLMRFALIYAIRSHTIYTCNSAHQWL